MLTIRALQIRVLQQLTQWVMIHPERIREKMEEHRDVDQATWVSHQSLGWPHRNTLLTKQ